MHKRRKTYAIVLLSTAVLSQTVSYGASAASTGTSAVTAATTATVATLDKLGSIALKSGVSTKLTDVGLFAQDSGNILTYTLTYYNSNSSSINLVDFFSKVTTTGGTVIQGSPVTASATIKKVAANSSQSVTYYVNIGKATKVNGVKISLYGWDFSSADYQKKIGTFTIPATYSSAVARGQSKKVTLSNLPITTQAESLQIYKYNGKVYAKIGLSLANLGTKVLTDTGLKGYLASSGGSIFELTLDDSSSGYKIQPQEKKILYYLTEIPSYMKTDNMALLFAQEDTTLKIDLPVVSYKLPAAVTPNLSVAANAIKKLTINSNTVETQLKSAKVYSEDDTAKWTLQFRVKNSGNKAVTLPAYEFAVKAVEGYSFPVDTTAFASLTLKPLEEKTIELNVDVPLKLNQGTMQLQMTEPAVTDKIIFPTAYYQIPYSLQTNNSLNTEYNVENSYGTFGVTLDSIQRLPWSDEDQVVAKISVRNTKSTSVQLPTLTGIIKAGESDLSSTTQVVTTSTQTILAPNETVELYVKANLPYAYNYEQLKVILQETANNVTTNFLSINTTQLETSIETLAVGSTFHIDITGKKAALLERRTTVYSGSNSNLMYTELEMNSEELRKSDQAQLVAYYKTLDNQYYEAEVSQSSTSTSPNGKNLVTIWSKLPLTVDTSQLVLYIGEGVADGKLTALGGTSTGYINTVGLSLNKTLVTPLASLLSLELFPYSLAVTGVTGTLNEGKDTLNMVMTYNLSKTGIYESGTYEHKLVMEVVDPYGQSLEKTLTLGTDLTVGNFKSYATTFNSNLYKTLTGGNIRVNIYDEFQGERILLGTQVYYLTYEATAIPETDDEEKDTTTDTETTSTD